MDPRTPPSSADLAISSNTLRNAATREGPPARDALNRTAAFLDQVGPAFDMLQGMLKDGTLDMADISGMLQEQYG